MIDLEPANTQETLQMACAAAHGRGHRIQERWRIDSLAQITIKENVFTSCTPAKLLPSSRRSWRSTRFWLSWGRKSAALFTIFIQTGSRAWICLFQMGCIISCNRIKSIGFSDGWCSPIMTQLAWRRIGPKCCRFSVVWKLASGIIWASRLCTANPSETRKTMLVGWTVSSSSRHRPTTLAVAGTLICPSRMRGTDVCLCCAEWNLGQIAVRFETWTALWWTSSSIMPRASAFSKTIVF